MEEQKKVEIINILNYKGKKINFPIEIELTIPSTEGKTIQELEDIKCDFFFSIIEQLVNAFPKKDNITTSGSEGFENEKK